jgi:hypothetical protein
MRSMLVLCRSIALLTPASPPGSRPFSLLPAGVKYLPLHSTTVIKIIFNSNILYENSVFKRILYLFEEVVIRGDEKMNEREWRTLYVLLVLTFGVLNFFLLRTFLYTDEPLRDFLLCFLVTHFIVKTSLLKPKT